MEINIGSRIKVVCPNPSSTIGTMIYFDGKAVGAIVDLTMRWSAGASEPLLSCVMKRYGNIEDQKVQAGLAAELLCNGFAVHWKHAG